ncbi:MAG: hypothetical protein KC615_14275 [Anaerolineae bacterium]|nr:hypothetical protein [Anaerolineae bacterium]MCA9894151.1 hypothetical protein [Anaerolineae bacterium]MCB9461528.1 hypothetical protein [Anaerolineaceae bacterium]
MNTRMNRKSTLIILVGLMVSLLTVVPVFAANTSDDPLPHFDDGRINNSDASPVVVYGDGESLEIWAPMYSFTDENGNAVLHSDIVLTVTAEEIAAVPAEPEENTLIAATDDMSVAVYRLTTGEYQMIASTYNGETYVLVFPELYPDAGYDSWFVK